MTTTEIDAKTLAADELLQAIWHKDRIKVKKLIHAGIDVNHNYYRRVPLIEAIEEQKRYKDPLEGELIIEDLIKAGADPNTIYPTRGRSYDRDVPAFFAVVSHGCSLKLIKVMLEHGANPNFLDDRGRGHAACQNQKSPFMLACATGDLTLMQLMLDYGADINLRNRAGTCPLIGAPRSPEMFDFLLAAGANINAPINSDNDTLLMKLVKDPKKESLVEYLLAHGADPNQTNSLGYTALHHATCAKNTEKNIELLFKYKARPNVTEHNFNRTPIYMACDKGHWSLVPCLVKHGADPKIKDDSGKDCRDLEITSGNMLGREIRVIRNHLAHLAAGNSR